MKFKMLCYLCGLGSKISSGFDEMMGFYRYCRCFGVFFLVFESEEVFFCLWVLVFWFCVCVIIYIYVVLICSFKIVVEWKIF